MKIHIATDHAGFELKSKILDYLISKGHEVIDHGAKSFDPDDDYPDYIFPCAKAVAANSKSAQHISKSRCASSSPRSFAKINLFSPVPTPEINNFDAAPRAKRDKPASSLC